MLGFLNPEESLLAGFENHQNDFIADLPDKLNEDTRWLAASALQKCIRLGLTQEALHAAHVLKTFSDTHLWYRLSVICLEDIGVANVDLAAQVLWILAFSIFAVVFVPMLWNPPLDNGAGVSHAHSRMRQEAART